MAAYSHHKKLPHAPVHGQVHAANLKPWQTVQKNSYSAAWMELMIIIRTVESVSAVTGTTITCTKFPLSV